MRKRKSRIFVGDFETTVYKNQENTEVWASACVELYTEDVKIFHSIREQFDYFKSLNSHIICYYHNLKFDGNFWLSFLLLDLHFEQAVIGDDLTNMSWQAPQDMANNTFVYNISNLGQWYRILIKVGGHIIEIRDSLKLLPFSVKKIGKSFKTKHKKLEMEYTGFRYAGCPISDEEKQYISNDVLVVKEALEFMLNEGHKNLTIGSCCLAEYRRIIGNDTYNMYFPNLYEIPLDKNIYGTDNCGDYIRRSYHGGWCYLVEGKENKIFHNGTTADVNSLYPSMMSSESGNRFPVGKPHFWQGNYIPEFAGDKSSYFFVRVRTRFYLKPGKLPFIQIKNSLLYRPNMMLKTSDVYSKKDDKYYKCYRGIDGKIHQAIVTMTLTMTDYYLFLEHYDVEDFEILDGVCFQAEVGIFDEYIEKYKKIKLESKGALRELAKLFLNNLYGKMAANTDSSFKLAFVKDDKSIGFYSVRANEKKPGYIPVGSAITSYARNFTIRAAQKNYHGVDKPGFIYADTDSIHCDLSPNDIEGITVHPKNFCCWKLESGWDDGIFVRQKTYIEHIVEEDQQPIEKPYYNVKCAGMPEKCKNLFIGSMTGVYPKGLSDEETEFISTKRALTDFKLGLKIPGKLLPKRIRGGVLLVETSYEMR